MPKTKEHIAVIQARMGSSRFPGKSFVSIAGKPLLWHIIWRLRKSKHLTRLVLATTISKENDILERFAEKEKISIIRGDEHDVLSRFERAFEMYNPSTITRICGDCPFVEASFVDRSIEQLVRQKVDYVKPASSQMIHQGIETISKACFQRNLHFKDDPVAKEHVTALIYKNAGLYKIGKIRLLDYEENSGIRLSIDTKSDLRFIRALYKKSSKKAGQLSIKQVIDIIKKDPSVLKYNSHVVQKKASQKTEHVYFHYKESLAKYFLKLAQEYSEKKGYGVKFIATPPNSIKIRGLKSHGFHIKILGNDAEVVSLISRDYPETFYSAYKFEVAKVRDLYKPEFEKKNSVYKFVRC